MHVGGFFLHIKHFHVEFRNNPAERVLNFETFLTQ